MTRLILHCQRQGYIRIWSLLLGKTQKPGRVSLLNPAIHIKKKLRLGEGVPN